MKMEAFLRQQGWQLVQRSNWIAVQDLRPEFYDVFKTKRIGKLIGTDFFVTLTHGPAITQGLILQAGGVLKMIRSTDRSRDVTYMGFDTALVSEHNLATFVRRLSDIINDFV